MKKAFSILLCIALLFTALAPLTFAATAIIDPTQGTIPGTIPGNYPPNGTNGSAPDPEPEEPIERSITISIPIVKEVVQKGADGPGKQTFTFKIADIPYEGDELSYTLAGNTIKTDGPGIYKTTLKIIAKNEASFDILSEGFVVSEEQETASGWHFDPYQWEISDIALVGSNVTYEARYLGKYVIPDDVNGLYFRNIYRDPETGYTNPTLNKDDHFAFMEGYPDKTFRAENNMTRAEVATMFARLMVEKMEIGVSYPCSFTDVKSDAWYADAIGYLERYGVVKAEADGRFRPDDAITRAEFATIACAFDKLTEGVAVFSDVDESHEAYQYINFAAAKGWVTGDPDGRFRPDDPITRAEIVTITCRMLERNADTAYIKAHEKDLPRTFTDVPNEKAHWAYWNIMEAANGHDYEYTPSETWKSVYQ